MKRLGDFKPTEQKKTHATERGGGAFAENYAVPEGPVEEGDVEANAGDIPF